MEKAFWKKILQWSIQVWNFFANNEICITNENACDIYTIHGIYKFHHEFEQTLYKIISEGGALNYTLILEDTTEKIRLK